MRKSKYAAGIINIIQTKQKQKETILIVISLNSGAFISELVRGALQGIDAGQREAGASLGLSL